MLHNICASFPLLSNKECKRISKKFYKQFCDTVMEGLKSQKMSIEQMITRWKVKNPELINTFLANQQSLLLVGPHYANWEWGMSIGNQLSGRSMSFYHRLRNAKINQLMLNLRNRFDIEMVDNKHAARTFLKYRNTPIAYALIFDQRPFGSKNNFWMNWLHQPTAVNLTPGIIANKFNYPIVYLDIKRIKRGYYEISLELLCEQSNQHTPTELCTQYMKTLEKQIQRNPAPWLWSHNRWRNKPNSGDTIIE